MKLAGKRAIVTGAGSGLGAAITQPFPAGGAAARCRSWPTGSTSIS